MGRAGTVVPPIYRGRLRATLSVRAMLAHFPALAGRWKQKKESIFLFVAVAFWWLDWICACGQCAINGGKFGLKLASSFKQFIPWFTQWKFTCPAGLLGWFFYYNWSLYWIVGVNAPGETNQKRCFYSVSWRMMRTSARSSNAWPPHF